MRFDCSGRCKPSVCASRALLRRRGGLVLTPEGASNIARAFERKQAERVRHPRLRVRVTYERMPFLQAQILARDVSGEIREYMAFHIDR